MLDSHAFAVDDRFPFTFEGPVPQPHRLPSPPDELVTHINQFAEGLDRVTVKVHTGRKRYAQINSIKIGALHGQRPKASVDQICKGVMAIAQDLVEERGQGQRFMIQAHVYLKPTGDAVRKSCHIELGEQDGHSVSESVDAPDRVDEVLLGHIRELHKHVLEQSRVIQTIGQSAIENTAHVFQARNEALEMQAAAQQTVLQNQAAERADQAREARVDRVLQTFEALAPVALKHALSGVSPGQLSQLVGATPAAAPGGAPQVPQAPAAAPSPSPMPAWAAAVQPPAAPPTPPTPPPSPSAPPVPAQTGAIDNVAPEGLPPHAPEDGPDANQHPVASLAHTLFHSIEPDQWGRLIDLLTKAQLQDLRQCGRVEEDEQACKVLVRFASKLKADQQVGLLGILSGPQMQWVMRLQSVATAWAEAQDQQAETQAETTDPEPA